MTSWHEYPVMAAIAAIGGVALVLLLNALGGGPAGDNTLKRGVPVRQVQVTHAPQRAGETRAERRAAERVRSRAAAHRRARAAEAPAPTPVAPPTGTSTTPYGTTSPTYPTQTTGQTAPVTPQSQQTPAPTTHTAPKPKGGTFDNSG